MWMCLDIYKTWTLVIITGFKHFGLWCGPSELLLLVGRIVIFHNRKQIGGNGVYLLPIVFQYIYIYLRER